MSDDGFVSCEYCGGDAWLSFELKDGKCQECFREECSHSTIVREYLGSNNHRVRFLEICLKCDGQRETRLFFHNRYPQRTTWLWEQ